LIVYLPFMNNPHEAGGKNLKEENLKKAGMIFSELRNYEQPPLMSTFISTAIREYRFGFSSNCFLQ
jgi:hypothetical protein